MRQASHDKGHVHRHVLFRCRQSVGERRALPWRCDTCKSCKAIIALALNVSTRCGALSRCARVHAATNRACWMQRRVGSMDSPQAHHDGLHADKFECPNEEFLCRNPGTLTCKGRLMDCNGQGDCVQGACFCRTGASSCNELRVPMLRRLLITYAQT